MTLRRAQNSPVWLIPDQNLEEAKRAAVVSGVGVDVELRIHVNPKEFTPQELDALQGAVEAEVRLTLGNFLRRSEEQEQH